MIAKEFVSHLRQTGTGSLTCRNVVGNLWTRYYTCNGHKFYAYTEAPGCFAQTVEIPDAEIDRDVRDTMEVIERVRQEG
jgi:hypothetical protein